MSQETLGEVRDRLGDPRGDSRRVEAVLDGSGDP